MVIITWPVRVAMSGWGMQDHLGLGLLAGWQGCKIQGVSGTMVLNLPN